ncbi:MAG: aquaporin [Chloroflexi bacterium]|nr:aquaporin [Chloroflexota bacterium]
MPNTLVRPAVAEFIGTFALIFIGAGSIVVNAFTTPQGGHGFSTLAGVALAHGLTIFAMAAALGHISGGHFNPAVTVAFLVTGRLNPATGALYIVSQLLGAALAAFILVATMPAEAVAAAQLGATLLAPGVSPAQGLLLEVVATFFLVSVIFGSAVDPRGAGAIAPLAIGMTVALDILAIGPLTGASMNPARSFGPALLLGAWSDHWVYWVAPILGGVVAALLYDYVISSKGKAA